MGAIGTAGATVPLTLWRGVDRVIVSCPSAVGDGAALYRNLCGEVVREAGRGSPYPVVTSSEAAAPTARDVVLQLDVRMEGPQRGRPATLSLSILPVRDDPRSEAAAMPGPRHRQPARVVLGKGSPDYHSLAAAELDRVLPWRSGGGRRLR